MVIDTTPLKFILTLEYKRRKVVLAFESMHQTKFSIVLFMNGLWVVLPFEFVDMTKSYDMTFQMNATRQKTFPEYFDARRNIQVQVSSFQV